MLFVELSDAVDAFARLFNRNISIALHTTQKLSQLLVARLSNVKDFSFGTSKRGP